MQTKTTLFWDLNEQNTTIFQIIFRKNSIRKNHLEETIVRIPSVDSRSETALVHRQYIDGALATVVF